MKFAVDKMTCGHCARTITRVLRAMDPQARVEVDLAAATVLVEGRVDAARVIAALAVAGYPARLEDSAQAHP